MNFLSDSYCFVHRTSTLANEFVESKNNPASFAFFFEQDYNLILVKASKVIKFVAKKFDNALLKFYTTRFGIIKYSNSILPNDYRLK